MSDIIYHRGILTLYQLIPKFNNQEKEAFWKLCGKRRKCWYQVFSPLPTMFSIPHQRQKNLQFSNINLSFANVFNLVMSKVPSFCTGLDPLSGKHGIPNKIGRKSKENEYLTKLYPSAAVSPLIQRWAPRKDAHHVWYDHKDTARNTGLCWQTHL